MPIPREVRSAYQRKVDDIIASVDKLSEDAVARALKLAEETRQEILNRLLAIPGDSFEARHLKALRSAVDRAVADLVRRYSAEVNGLLERAHDLGIDLAEDPLKAAATAAAGAAPILPGGVIGRQTLEILQGFSADLIQGIGFDARRKINGILAQAALGNMHAVTAIKRIAGELPNRSVFATVGSRASTIYRTEVGRAFSMTAEARMGQMHERLPGLKKEWVAYLDDRTRATHVLANGQVRPVDKPFDVGGHEAKFPRDPALPADESVNCRCVHVPLLDDVVMADLGVTGQEIGTPAPVISEGETPEDFTGDHPSALDDEPR